MASSKTEICNLALRHLGRRGVSNVDTERSPEAIVCKQFYPLVVKKVMRDWRYNITTKRRALGLIEEEPNDEWAYAYQYPVDCLDFGQIVNGQREQTEGTPTPFRVVKGDAGTVIWTDQAEAEGEYTAFDNDPARYPEDLVLVISLLLASYIAPSITGGDQYGLGQLAEKRYQSELSQARANAANEHQPDPPADTPYIHARN